MLLDEVKKEKVKLQYEIQRSLDKFIKATGEVPDSVSVDIRKMEMGHGVKVMVSLTVDVIFKL